MADETKENTEDKTKTAATNSSDDNIFVTDDNTDYTGFDYITSKSEDYLSMSSNELLVKARSQYDANYDAAIYNAHKFLQSACQHCSSVLDKTTDIIRAKGELLKNGINVFAQTPEPQPEAIGNTALVVPKLTAEEDFKNRYETPMGSESGGSSSSGSGSSSSGSIGSGYKGTGPISHTDEDLKALAQCITIEAGGQTYEWQMCVACVIINRVADPDYPDSIQGVIFQPGQYEGAGSDSWWSKEMDPVSMQVANDILSKGKPTDVPDNVVYQAGFEQGSGVWKVFGDGEYFCYK